MKNSFTDDLNSAASENIETASQKNQATKYQRLQDNDQVLTMLENSINNFDPY